MLRCHSLRSLISASFSDIPLPAKALQMGEKDDGVCLEVEILCSHETICMSGGITGGTSKKKFTVDGRGEDTKKSVISVLPDWLEVRPSEFFSGPGTTVRR
jgi:hypothetical protein